MALSPQSFATLERVLDLIGAPLTLEILDGLGHGVPPADAVPVGTDPSTIPEAVDHLRRFGAVRGPFPSTGDDTLSLTPLGRRLLTALEKAAALEDPAADQTSDQSVPRTLRHLGRSVTRQPRPMQRPA